MSDVVAFDIRFQSQILLTVLLFSMMIGSHDPQFRLEPTYRVLLGFVIRALHCLHVDPFASISTKVLTPTRQRTRTTNSSLAVFDPTAR